MSSGGSEDPSSPSSEDTAAEFDERSAVHNVTATSATLTGLSPHTWYQITVQAYNGRGFSPRAAGARARTLEDVPSEPPRHLTCAGAGPRRVSVSWEQPPADALNGRLRGYQVKTEAVDEVNGESVSGVEWVSGRAPAPATAPVSQLCLPALPLLWLPLVSPV